MKESKIKQVDIPKLKDLEKVSVIKDGIRTEMKMKKIVLPKEWSDITISKWRELESIRTDNEVSELIQKISILADMDSEEVRALPIKEFQDLVGDIELLNKQLPLEYSNTFMLDGKKYGIIPDLNYITTGEYVDIESWKDDPPGNVHLISALLFRPVIWEEGDQYRIQRHKPEGFMNRAKLFLEKLPITRVYGALVFFLSIAVSYSQIMMEYLEEEDQLTEQETMTKTTQSDTKKSK